MTQEITIEHLQQLIDAFCADYANYVNNDNLSTQYNASFTWTIGTKYIKILRNRSVVAFIVNVHNHNVPYGSVLAPVNYATPNFRLGSRFSIFAIKPERVSWLGLR